MLSSSQTPFYNAWIVSSHAYAVCYKKAEDNKGDVIMRKCYEGYQVGPLFADDYRIATALSYGVLVSINNEWLYIDVVRVLAVCMFELA